MSSVPPEELCLPEKTRPPALRSQNSWLDFGSFAPPLSSSKAPVGLTPSSLLRLVVDLGHLMDPAANVDLDVKDWVRESSFRLLVVVHHLLDS